MALEAFFFDDGFPRCLPADNGYPNCGAWIGHFEQCAGLAAGDRRRLVAETGNFSEDLTAMGPVVNFPCPGNIYGYGSPDNNYVIGSVASCDVCIQSHFSSLPDTEESVEEVWNQTCTHAPLSLFVRIYGHHKFHHLFSVIRTMTKWNGKKLSQQL